MPQARHAADIYRTDIRATLHERQRFVRIFLQLYIERTGKTPTGLELVAFIQRQCPEQLIDVNTVRPRLTEMETLGYVRHGEKRRCSLSSKRVWTWELSQPRALDREPEIQRLQF